MGFECELNRVKMDADSARDPNSRRTAKHAFVNGERVGVLSKDRITKALSAIVKEE